MLVPGNHERYAPAGDPRTAPDLLAALEAEVARRNRPGARIHLLQRAQTCIIDGVRFIGATLWSDWDLAGRWLAPDDPDRPDDPVAYAAARMTDPVTGSREYLGSIRKGRRQPVAALRRHGGAHAVERAALHAALRPAACWPDRGGHASPGEPPARPTGFATQPGVPWWVPAFYASTALDDLADAQRPDAVDLRAFPRGP